LRGFLCHHVCGLTLRDCQHGFCQVAVGACDTLQVQFLYFMEVLLCSLRIAGCRVAQ
jgi:hypothetical protein